jgi:hypothetical protein
VLTKEDLKRIISQELEEMTRDRPSLTLPPVPRDDLYLRFYSIIASAGIPLDEVYKIFDEAIRDYRKHTGELLEKQDCFDNKTFKGKSKCISRTKGLSKKAADTYTATVVRKMEK